MRFFYFDADQDVVHVLPEESTSHGVFLGSVSENDFGVLNTNFVVQALFTKAKINRSGMTVRIVFGPSSQP